MHCRVSWSLKLALRAFFRSGAPNSALVAELTARGYFVLSGVKYGVDFAIYEGDPAAHHGFFLLQVTESARACSYSSS